MPELQQHSDRFFLSWNWIETHYKCPGGINIFFILISVAFSRQYNYYSMAFALLLHAWENMLHKRIFTIVSKIEWKKKRSPFSSFSVLYHNINNMQYGKYPVRSIILYTPNLPSLNRKFIISFYEWSFLQNK